MNRLYRLKAKIGKKAALASGLLVMGVASAHAALPAAADTAFTNAGTAVTDVETAAWPVIGASIVAFLIIRLVKRGAKQV